MKVVIIGGVAAGMSAASKIRRTQYDSEVVVYEKGETLSYGACGLPYYIGDEIKDPNIMIARTKKAFENMGITIHIKHEVINVDDVNKTVEVKNLETGEIITDNYDKLLVASGASPVMPNWKGINSENVFSLSSLKDGMIIKEAVNKPEIKNVGIIGAGFIGVELVEAMVNLNKNVTLIEFKNQIVPHFDKEMVMPLQEELISKGVTLKLGEKVEEFEESGNKVTKIITDKNSYEVDLVIVCIGVRPNTSFLKSTSVRLERNGAVIVDKEMKTNVTDIYSAGDCATIYHRVLDTMNAHIPLGTNANKQGKLAGSIICGKKMKFNGALGTVMIKVCGMEGAKTGLSEREAIMNNFDYKTITVKANNHATYYPNPRPIIIKLVYDAKTKKILGAQLVGYDGAAIRVDIFALAIHTGITTDELGMVDFGYAPPFAGVWDAVHIACNAVK
jgi:NADPH-dependent 2,4-dienoyl-CoA reductase/sulfur reductase-like enzyme